MSTSAFQDYEFSNLPIKTSGGDVIGRFSGTIERRLRGSLRPLYGLLMVRAENGGLIEVLDEEPVYDVITEALEAQRESDQKGAEATPSDLDTEAEEGAQKDSG